MRTVCPTCGREYLVADSYDGWLCPYGCVPEDEPAIADEDLDEGGGYGDAA